ncbi:MAG TPA: hypothetical protein VE153_27690 [Myxococcus sp.]|nr:hypothetical protein [Myxococcus sp.]
MTEVGALAAAAVAAVFGVLWFFKSRRTGEARPEVCERCGKARVLLDEQTEDLHLSEGQRIEEQAGSVDYHVWWCGSCEAGTVVRHELGSVSRFVRCEKCRLATATEVVQTLKPATPADGGEFRVQLSCQHCGHYQQFWRYTPRQRAS